VVETLKRNRMGRIFFIKNKIDKFRRSHIKTGEASNGYVNFVLPEYYLCVT
jgi:hypothetical protein